MTIHVICGISGSGKTTLSKKLALECNAILYCYDIFPKGHCKNDVHSAMYECIVKDLQNHNNVICDDLHITKDSRKFLLNALYGVECIKILHVMQTPFDVCVNRNHNRKIGRLPDIAIKHYQTKYEEPTLDEGWDEIIYHEYIRE